VHQRSVYDAQNAGTPVCLRFDIPDRHEDGEPLRFDWKCVIVYSEIEARMNDAVLLHLYTRPTL
jgi:hypothetical protein